MKGDIGGECNRGACNISPAIWYNTSTKKHYCQRCAFKINDLNNETVCVKVATINHDGDVVMLDTEHNDI